MSPSGHFACHVGLIPVSQLSARHYVVMYAGGSTCASPSSHLSCLNSTSTVFRWPLAAGPTSTA
eukprot:5152363-Pyramimonas_sp.AAC.1